MMLNQKWKNHHFALGAANTVDVSERPPTMLVTDIDINSIKFTVPEKSLVPSEKELYDERI